jgi:hypothetical protein
MPRRGYAERDSDTDKAEQIKAERRANLNGWRWWWRQDAAPDADELHQAAASAFGGGFRSLISAESLRQRSRRYSQTRRISEANRQDGAAARTTTPNTT